MRDYQAGGFTASFMILCAAGVWWLLDMDPGQGAIGFSLGVALMSGINWLCTKDGA